MARRRLAPLVLSALLASACTYDFQEFVGSEATGGGGSGTGASGGASRGGESNGGSTNSGGSANSGGSTSGGASAKGGTSNGGSASAAGGKSSSGGASAGGRAASGGSPGTTGGGGSSSGGAAAGGSGSKACAGTTLNSICWYLGTANQSCTDVCSAHGGVNTASEKMVGVPAQGGSVTSCALVLAALGTRDLPAEATRSDGNGLGCHVISGRSDTAYWLSSPRFSETAHLSNASIACGCNQ